MEPLPPRKPEPSALERLRYVLLGMMLLLTGSCVAYVGMERNQGVVAPALGIILMVGSLVLMMLGRRWGR